MYPQFLRGVRRESLSLTHFVFMSLVLSIKNPIINIDILASICNFSKN